MKKQISFPATINNIRNSTVVFLGYNFLFYLISLLLFCLVLVHLFLKGDRTWLLGVFLTLAISCVFSLMKLPRHYFQRVERFKKMKDALIKVEFSDDDVFFESELGSMKLSWNLVSCMLKTRKTWVLVLPGNQILTLPTEYIDDESKSFINSKVKVRPNRNLLQLFFTTVCCFTMLGIAIWIVCVLL